MIYTLDDIAAAFTAKAASYLGWRYRHYRVEADDVMQEIYVWLYGDGKRKVERWLESKPQQTTRIYQSMLAAGQKYAEREKANKVGYNVDDVYWYTPSAIEGLMPLVLDDTFTQENGHIGELITMVIDIRIALGRGDLYEFFMENDDSNPAWDENIHMVVDKLGGDRPYVGRRKAMSNAKAAAITSEDS